MLISYDPIVKAAYITLDHTAKVARTVRLSDNTSVDLNARGRLIGVELLHPASAKLGPIASRFRCPDLRKIHPRKLQELVA
jgi:uncharacterized protein YuzE